MKPDPRALAEKTLDVLEQMERVAANPYLYARLQARMAREDRRLRVQWALQLAVVACLILGNALSITWKWQTLNRQDPVEVMADEYGLMEAEWVSLTNQQE